MIGGAETQFETKPRLTTNRREKQREGRGKDPIPGTPDMRDPH